jgi:hypothetical protein
MIGPCPAYAANQFDFRLVRLHTGDNSIVGGDVMVYVDITEIVLARSNIPVIIKKICIKARSYKLVKDAHLEFHFNRR